MKTRQGRAFAHGNLTPVALKNTAFSGGFWADRIDNNRRVTIPAEYRLCRETGHIDA